MGNTIVTKMQAALDGDQRINRTEQREILETWGDRTYTNVEREEALQFLQQKCTARNDACLLAQICTRDWIDRVVAGSRDDLRSCYEELLLNKPDAKGDVLVSFTIRPDGTLKINDMSTAMDHEGTDFLKRLTASFAVIRFPRLSGGEPIEVKNYPLHFGEESPDLFAE